MDFKPSKSVTVFVYIIYWNLGNDNNCPVHKNGYACELARSLTLLLIGSRTAEILELSYPVRPLREVITYITESYPIAAHLC